MATFNKNQDDLKPGAAVKVNPFKTISATRATTLGPLLNSINDESEIEDILESKWSYTIACGHCKAFSKKERSSYLGIS